jgi:hypothetical protein
MLTVLDCVCACPPEHNHQRRPQLRPELGLFFSEGEALAGHDPQTDHGTP